jgi:hypothetical protein
MTKVGRRFIVFKTEVASSLPANQICRPGSVLLLSHTTIPIIA